MAETSSTRPTPPTTGAERELLAGFLDFNRATILQKLSGLSEEAAKRATIPPSTLSVLGLVKHLAFVEMWWFQCQFRGMPDPSPQAQDDPDFDFRIGPDETIASITAFYQAEVETARQIINSAGLDDLSVQSSRSGNKFTLRWIIMHMIEETARHNGHADLLRQALDGMTGF